MSDSNAAERVRENGAKLSKFVKTSGANTAIDYGGKWPGFRLRPVDNSFLFLSKWNRYSEHFPTSCVNSAAVWRSNRYWMANRPANIRLFSSPTIIYDSPRLHNNDSVGTLVESKNGEQSSTESYETNKICALARLSLVYWWQKNYLPANTFLVFWDFVVQRFWHRPRTRDDLRNSQFFGYFR